MSNRRFSGPPITYSRLTPDQQNNAKIIVNDAIARAPKGQQAQVAIIALMTAITESTLNSDTGAPSDHDSGGLFQQRPSAGWGTYEQVRDPNYATNKFLDRLLSNGALLTVEPWAASQTVQNSAFSDGSNYQDNYTDAVSLYQSMGGKGGPVVNATGNVVAPLKGKPPYPAYTLTDPLTDAQRNKIIDYMARQAGDPGTQAYKDMVKQLQGLLSHTLRISYDSTVSGNLPKADPGYVDPMQQTPKIPNPLSWADGLAKALGWLTNVHNWERIGLFVLGAVFLLIAALQLFKPVTDTIGAVPL